MLTLRGMVDGSENNLVLLHLMQHPEDTGTVLQMMAEARDKNQAVQLGLLDRMLENNLITDADAQPLRDSVLGRTAAPVKMRPITRAQHAALPAVTTPQAAPPGQPPASAPADAEATVSSPAHGSAPAKKVYAVGDSPAPAQPAPAPPAGGVKKWKPLKKDPDQEPE
jgi:hypothetical protein